MWCWLPGQRTRQVEAGQQQAGRFLLAERVDGDQATTSLAIGGAGAVDQAAELAGGDGGGQAPHHGQGDPAGGVTEDELFLFEGPEQAVRANRRLRAVTGGWLLRTAWMSCLVISRRLPARPAQLTSVRNRQLR